MTKETEWNLCHVPLRDVNTGPWVSRRRLCHLQKRIISFGKTPPDMVLGPGGNRCHMTIQLIARYGLGPVNSSHKAGQAQNSSMSDGSATSGIKHKQDQRAHIRYMSR